MDWYKYVIIMFLLDVFISIYALMKLWMTSITCGIKIGMFCGLWPQLCRKGTLETPSICPLVNFQMYRTPHEDDHKAYASTSRGLHVRAPSPHALSNHFLWSVSPPFTLLIHMWHLHTINRDGFDQGDEFRWSLSKHRLLPPSSLTFSASQIGHSRPKST